jgi:hypothetical protein
VHATHTADAVAPVATEAVFPGQLVHAAAPPPAWYLPPAHGAHAVEAAAPEAAEKAPAAQPTQAVALAAFWYCPPAQGRQPVAPVVGW